MAVFNAGDTLYTPPDTTQTTAAPQVGDTLYNPQLGDGSVVTNPKTPLGKDYWNPSNPILRKYLQGMDALAQGLGAVDDMVSAPGRMIGNAIGFNTTKPSQRAVNDGVTGNPYIEPDSSWSQPERSAFAATRGVGAGAAFGLPGVVGSVGSEIAGDASRNLSPTGQALISLGAGLGTGKGAEWAYRGAGTGLNALTRTYDSSVNAVNGLPPMKLPYSPLSTSTPTYQAATEIPISNAFNPTQTMTPRIAADFGGSPITRLVTGAMAKLPGSSGVIQDARAAQTADLASGVDQAATDLQNGTKYYNTTTKADAGQALQDGANNWLANFKTQNTANQNVLGAYMQNQPIPLTNTLQKLTDINGLMSDAPATAKLVQNSQFGRLQASLQKDLATNPNGLSWDTVRQLRTSIGDQLNDPALYGDTNRAQIKQLYGALTQDLGAAAAAHPTNGPAASAAFDKMNSYAKTNYDLLDTTMQGLIKKGITPEQTYNYAMSQPSRLDTILNGVKDANGKVIAPGLSPDERAALGSQVVRQMGLASPANQNAAGNAFSPSAYATNFMKLKNQSPEAFNALFQNNPEVTQNLENINTVANAMKKTAQGDNHSNTATAMAVLEGIGGVGEGIREGYKEDGLAGAAKGGLAGAAGVGVALGGSNLAARLMTSPTFTKWLATNPTGPLNAARLQGLAGVVAANPALAPDIEAYKQEANKRLQQR